MRRLELVMAGFWAAALPIGLGTAQGAAPPAPEVASQPNVPGLCDVPALSLAVAAEQDPPPPPQSPAQSSAAPGTAGPLVVQKHPHLIELTSKNWQPLTRRDKFGLFWRDMIDWQTHASLAVDAAIAFATDDRDYLGEGGRGYVKRYGLNVVDEANGSFVQAFLLPVLFHEDPRYIPLEQGSIRRRAAYAVTRVLFTRSDSGGTTLHKSKILGTVASSALSNAYNYGPGRNTNLEATMARAAINLASDAAFDLFKEFWPDVARKIRLNVWIRNVVRSAIREGIRVD